MDYVKLTNEKLCVATVYNLVCSPEFGAVSLFVGTTRDNFEGKIVRKLEYEAYEGMAIKKMENMCKEIRQKFNVGNVAVYHRLGEVPVKEASVIIAMSSPHRNEVLEAMPYAIDALKQDVPIWKKEIYEGDEIPQWKENPECAWSSKDVECLPAEVALYEEVIEPGSTDVIPPDLIQINANFKEINRRISSFIYRKREQVNLSNLQDFCSHTGTSNTRDTCARVDAVLRRRKDSKSHLKVHRVQNIVGPQAQDFEPGSSEHFPEAKGKAVSNCPPGAEERLANAEQYLGVSASLDVFARLKAIEDKILFLEGVSPEYYDFIKQEKIQPKKGNLQVKRTFSSLDLDLKLQELETKLLNKS